jgi:hypothetical protein
MPEVRRSLYRLGLVVAATTLAGCSDVVRIGRTRTLGVALSEYRVNPSSTSAPSGVIELVVRNYGRLSHNVVVSGKGHADGATPAIPPGNQATLLLDLTPGVYTISSSILNDAALGIRGTLTVTYN